jgi:hypothetical protein
MKIGDDYVIFSLSKPSLLPKGCPNETNSFSIRRLNPCIVRKKGSRMSATKAET